RHQQFKTAAEQRALELLRQLGRESHVRRINTPANLTERAAELPPLNGRGGSAVTEAVELVVGATNAADQLTGPLAADTDLGRSVRRIVAESLVRPNDTLDFVAATRQAVEIAHDLDTRADGYTATRLKLDATVAEQTFNQLARSAPDTVAQLRKQAHAIAVRRFNPLAVHHELDLDNAFVKIRDAIALQLHETPGTPQDKQTAAENYATTLGDALDINWSQQAYDDMAEIITGPDVGKVSDEDLAPAVAAVTKATSALSLRVHRYDSTVMARIVDDLVLFDAERGDGSLTLDEIANTVAEVLGVSRFTPAKIDDLLQVAPPLVQVRSEVADAVLRDHGGLTTPLTGHSRHDLMRVVEHLLRASGGRPTA